MFFKRKQKLDSKVRFQHKQFTGKLNTARSYRRKPNTTTESKVDKFLSTIGLGPRWRQATAILFVLALFYLIYLPNFLTIQTISVTGLSDQQRDVAEDKVMEIIQKSPFWNPQHNIVFLDTKKLQSTLLELGTIQQIASIKKDYRNRALVIDAEQKYTKFIVANEDEVIDVFNDGTYRGLAAINATQWEQLQDTDLIKVKITGQIEDLSVGDQIIEEFTYKTMQKLHDQLRNMEGFDFKYFDFTVAPLIELPVEEDLEQPETTDEVVETELVEPEQEIEQPEVDLSEEPQTWPLKNVEIKAMVGDPGGLITPFVVLFDSQSDEVKDVEQLKLLLSQTSFERLARMSYIDMRIPDRAYLCLRNTPCAN